MDRCAIGLCVHTGWAACVAAGGSLRAPRIEAREEIGILDDADRFLFHRAAEQDLAEAKSAVARLREEALRRATAALAGVLGRLRGEGHAVVGCAIVASGAPMRPLEEIVAAHPRIHAAEGCFYRDVLLQAMELNQLPARTVAPKSLGYEGLLPLLADAGRTVGRPWAKDQKLAALAAWTVL